MTEAAGGFAGPAGGNPGSMTFTQRQSIKPPPALIFLLVAMVLLFGVIWGVVTLSVRAGGTACPSHVQGGQPETRCR